jgi:prepilin-type N-terminal cleavage/methylation domain-containing protein
MKKRNGFTLIELLAVIVILGIIMMIAIPNVISTVEKQEKNSYISDANKLITMAKYALRTNTDIPYPDPDQVVILYFSYIDNGDIETDPEGRTYDSEQSYVALKHTDDNYIEYWVQLVGVDARGNRGVPLTSEVELGKDMALNLVKKNFVPTTGKAEIGNRLYGHTISASNIFEFKRTI